MREVFLHVEVVYVEPPGFRVYLSAEETALRIACRPRDFFVVDVVAAGADRRGLLNRKVATHSQLP